MRILALLPFVVLIFSACSEEANQDEMYKDSPLITAVNKTIDYRVGGNWFRGEWDISPAIEHDTLPIICYSPVEDFLFKTDQDSISFKIKPGSSEDFYVLLNDSVYAHTVVQGVPFVAEAIEFEDSEKNESIQILYQKGESVFLNELRKSYPIEISNDAKSDLDKVLVILDWASNRWEHDSNIPPKKDDAISILQEAEEGGQFPCFAFGIVLKDQLNANGFKARTIYLKTKDASYCNYPAGHVATEVYLEDLEKWVFLDGQFNILPMLKGTPLNAVEFQWAISDDYSDFVLQSLKESVAKDYYVDFIYKYLFYFDVALDNRYDVDTLYTIDGNMSLMLVPEGAENLSKIDFWNSVIDYCVYTNSMKDFYAKPK